jgi:hypothetical protein
LYSELPHKGEKMGIFHNIQEDEKMGDKGGKMPRIYVSLDNKKA